jgi:drug/metabolite transporter (DMT)-like permease
MNRANAALLLATLSWGLSLTVADRALADLTAADLLLVEGLTGTAVVALLCLVTGRRIGGSWRPAVVLGSLEPGIAYVFANLGLVLTSAAVGSMLFALESVFTVAIGAVLLRTRPRRIESIALVLGVLGTILVASAESGGRSSALGIGFMIMSTFASAAYVFATRRFAAGHEPLALVVRQGLASLLITSPFVLVSWLVEGSHLTTAPAGGLLLGGLSGVLGFAVPFTLWTVSVPHVRPGFAAVTLNVTPLVGVVSASLLGQGMLTVGQWLGGALILIGVISLTRSEVRATHDDRVTAIPQPARPDQLTALIPPKLTVPGRAARLRRAAREPGFVGRGRGPEDRIDTPRLDHVDAAR